MERSAFQRRMRLLKLIKGRFESAEAALCAISREIDAAECERSEYAEQLLKSQQEAAEPSYAVFAERRRAALKARIATLSERLAMLTVAKERRRRAFESALRQKLVLEKSLESDSAELKRIRSRAG